MYSPTSSRFIFRLVLHLSLQKFSDRWPSRSATHVPPLHPLPPQAPSWSCLYSREASHNLLPESRHLCILHVFVFVNFFPLETSPPFPPHLLFFWTVPPSGFSFSFSFVSLHGSEDLAISGCRQILDCKVSSRPRQNSNLELKHPGREKVTGEKKVVYSVALGNLRTS